MSLKDLRPTENVWSLSLIRRLKIRVLILGRTVGPMAHEILQCQSYRVVAIAVGASALLGNNCRYVAVLELAVNMVASPSFSNGCQIEIRMVAYDV